MFISFFRRKSFVEDDRGVSAVEFALIAPVLLFALLGLTEMGSQAYQRMDMHGALRTGGQYILNGGRDLDVAREVVERSWTSMPEDAVVETTRTCYCDTDEHACSTPCDDDSVPVAYINLRAHATLNGVLVSAGETADDSIRVR